GRVVDSIGQADERPVQRSRRIPNLSDSRDLKERVVLNQIVTCTAGKGGKWHLREIVAGRNQPIEFILNSRAELPEQRLVYLRSKSFPGGSGSYDGLTKTAHHGNQIARSGQASRFKVIAGDRPAPGNVFPKVEAKQSVVLHELALNTPKCISRGELLRGSIPWRRQGDNGALDFRHLLPERLRLLGFSGAVGFQARRFGGTELA